MRKAGFSIVRMFSVLLRAGGCAFQVCLGLAILLPGLMALDPARPLPQLSQKVWRIEEGLPENFVRTLLQTRDGYIWLGTQEGLVRFDGMQLRVFDTRNTRELRSNSIVTLCEDREGVLWIGTDGGGITRYAGGRFLDNLGKPEGLENDYIRHLYAAPDGGVWITAHSGGLIRMRGKERQRWTTADGLPSDSLRTVLQDRQGRLWIGADEAGLSLWENGVSRRFGPADGLAGDQIRVLYEDSRGQVWVGTRGAGLYRWDGKRFRVLTIRDGLPGISVRAIHEDRGGALWIGLESGGLARYHHGRFEVLDTTQGLPHNFVRALLEDSEGNLWVGTRGGLLRLRERTVNTWTTTEGLINDNVKTVFADSAGSVWVGTSTGLNLIRGGKIQTINLSGDWAKDFVRAIAQGPDGAMWFGTDNGLYRRDNRGIQRWGKSAGLPDNRIRAIAHDSQGQVWVATVRGLAIVSPRGVVAGERLGGAFAGSGLDSDQAHAIAADAAGAVWIGSGRGLFRYAGGGLRRFTEADGLPHNAISALHVDGHGRLWVGTRGGLSQMRGERFTSFTRRDGLLSDNILEVLDDGRGALWLSSPRSVSRVEIAELERFSRGEIAAIQPVSFDTADGMKSSELSGEGQPAGTRARDGRLWFPTAHGLVVFNPAELTRGGEPPRLLIEELRTGKQTYSASSKTVVIPAGTGDLEFQYTAISFGAPEKIRFRYMLEGFDTDWVGAGRRRVAYYTNLPPGDYRFRVEANPYNGSLPVEEVSQVIRLEPHFYQQTWFYLCWLALLAGLALLAHRIRVRGMQRRFDAVLAERVRIAREIHDTLMQGVTGISLQLEASSRQLLASPAQAKERIDVALEKLDATLAEARECILELRSPAAPPCGLAGALREMAEQLTRGLPIDLQFEVRGVERTLPGPQHAEFLRIAREAVTNTAAHAKADRLRITLAFEPDRVRFAAYDDGQGFQLEAVNGGHFGIVGMRERARGIGAELDIRSAPGAGTEVVVELPTSAHA